MRALKLLSDYTIISLLLLLTLAIFSLGLLGLLGRGVARYRRRVGTRL